MSSSFSSSGIGGSSIHNDVLDANPKTLEEQKTLLDELKRRGKSTVMAKSYPHSEMLYGKAIDVLQSMPSTDDNNDELSPEQEEKISNTKNQELAIMYSNRSLARYHLGKLEESESDARKSSTLDPTYTKAYWRCGQALSALKRHSDAKEIYEAGLAACGATRARAFEKEIEKCNVKIEEERKLLEDSATAGMDGMDIDPSASKTTTTTSKTSSTTTKSKTTTTSSSSSSSSTTTATSDTVKEKDNKLFTKSDHVRGYKIVNGKKTSYFHNELSENAKKLIGDIAPKKLDPSTTTTNAPQPINNSPGSSNGKTSVWNQAGTWEERDTTPWATKTLKEALLSASYTLPDSAPQPGAICRITKVKALDGHASVATVRGKRRYIYEFATTLEWEMTIPDGNINDDAGGDVFKGSLEFPDIDGTCDGEYDMTNYKVTDGGKAGGAARHLLDRFVKNGGLRDVLTEKLNGWVTLFQNS